LLPLHLQPEQHIAVIYPSKKAWTEVADRTLPIEELVQQIQQRHANVSVHPMAVQTDIHNEILPAVQQADLILAVAVNANLDAQQATLMQALLQSGRPVI